MPSTSPRAARCDTHATLRARAHTHQHTCVCMCVCVCVCVPEQRSGDARVGSCEMVSFFGMAGRWTCVVVAQAG
jgi:hypothetical protein